MSKFKEHASKKVATYRATVETHKDKAVTNFMGMNSYTLNPLDTLKIVAASSIFGEPSYYRDSHAKKSYIRRIVGDSLLSGFLDEFKPKSTTEVFTVAIDKALDYDFMGTLALAEQLRKEYNMRLNPSVILIRALMHPSRAKFNAEHGNAMRNILNGVIQIPSDMTNQFEYWMFVNGKKNKMPSLLKKVWADKLSGLSAYHINKYKEDPLIDLVRISHANSDLLNQLMKTGKVDIKDTEQTHTDLRSAGKSWVEILDTIKMPHMALLKNLNGIFTESNLSIADAKKILEHLKSGVPFGKQFPYRYYSAYNTIANGSAYRKGDVKHKALLLDTLEECIDIAMQNFPKLSGRTMTLCDNSGSARGAVTSEYGTVHVSDIANLSGIMTAINSDEGYVGVFGDKLTVIPVSKRNGVLTQHKKADEAGSRVGGGTENGIWLFFQNAIDKKEHWDNIFIYSDQQAGHGGLYGINDREHGAYRYQGSNHIDVLKLVTVYRQNVNPKVNVYSVQVAGYDNSVLPENLYRTAILSGWTGKEVVYAEAMNRFWDDKESNIQSQK